MRINELIRIFLECAKKDYENIGIFKKNENGEFWATEDEEIDMSMDMEEGRWIKLFDVHGCDYLLEII